MAASKVRHTRAEKSAAGFFMSEQIAMIKLPLSSAAASNAMLPARPGLDLDGWPHWIRDALAIQPETAAPAKPAATPHTARWRGFLGHRRADFRLKLMSAFGPVADRHRDAR
jgi:hypothetical protein